MFRKCFVCLAANSRPTLALNNNLMGARLDARLADGLPLSAERRRRLETHFCRSVESAFGFSSEESLRTAGVCHQAFDLHLRSEEAVDDSVREIALHFAPQDVLFNPQVFALNARTLRRRLLVLKELSFCRLSVAASDALFRAVVRHSAQTLQELGFRERDTPLVRHLLVAADVEPEFHATIESQFGAEDSRDTAVEDVRRRVVAQYLSLRLCIDGESARELVERKRTPRLYLTPLTSVVANTRLLTRDLHFSSAQLVRNAALLTLETQNARRVVERVSRVGEHSLREICLKYPKLLDTKSATIEANVRLLREEGFSARQVSKAPLVLCLATDTLRARVQQMRADATLAAFADNDRVLRLVLSMKTSLRRLAALRADGFSALSLDHLVGSHAYFESVRLRTTNERGGIEAFVLQRLGASLESARPTVGRHPHEQRFCAENALKVWLFLAEEAAMTSSQLKSGLFVVLYDCALVRRELALLRLRLGAEWHEWREDERVLQLLIYFIEKKYGFSGNGVYVTSAVDDVIT